MMDELQTLKRQVARLEKQMDEMQIYHYVAVTPAILTDSAATAWNAAAIGTGAYTFRPQDNANIWPARARAVVIMLGGRCTSASQSNYIESARTSGGTAEMVIRAQVANIAANIQGVQAVDTGGYFYVTVGGATFTATLRIVGYIV